MKSKRILGPLVALFLIALGAGCTSTGMKNQTVLAPSAGRITAPLSIKVTLEDKENEDLKPVILKAVAKQLKKQKIATVDNNLNSYIDIKVERIQRVGVWKRRWLGNLAKPDQIEVTVKWSDGSAIKQTATTKWAYANSGHIEDAIDELAEAIAKQTKAKLTSATAST